MLRVVEGGDASLLVNGSEIYEEHVDAACPGVGLLGSALDVDVWSVLSKLWGCYV